MATIQPLPSTSSAIVEMSSAGTCAPQWRVSCLFTLVKLIMEQCFGRPFIEYLDTKWAKPSFNIASLAGMVFCGNDVMVFCVLK
jgi:hypothetical protein